MGVIGSFLRLLRGEIPTSILQKRGLLVGRNFNRQQGCYIDPTHCYLIRIGDDVTMSVRTVLMAHDASTKKLTGYTRLGKIVIGNQVFIGANVTVLPGVTIGDRAVIGAGSVVTRDVPAGMVACGNPARVIGTVEDLKQRAECEMNAEKSVFDATYRMGSGLTAEKKKEIMEAVQAGTAYID